jgi:hypothetical protein
LVVVDMIREESSLLKWSRFSDNEKIDYLRSNREIPYQILALASQDSSDLVRSEILLIFDQLAETDLSWLSILRKMSESDPNSVLKNTARSLLNVYTQ